jgi:phosphotransferase system HPr (HPr) family protein
MFFGKVECVEMLHARPASNFVREASIFSSNISVECNEKKSDAKSILGILALGANSGDVLEITASGPDEKNAVLELINFVKAGCEKSPA